MSAHSLVRREGRQDCVVCKKEGTLWGIKKRRVHGELSPNQVTNLVGTGCRKSTLFGCKVCDYPFVKIALALIDFIIIYKDEVNYM